MGYLLSIVFIVVGFMSEDLSMAMNYWQIAALFMCAGSISIGLTRIANSDKKKE